MMFPSATTQSESSRTTYPFEKRPDYYTEPARPQMGFRQSLDLPRPLEPRPIHHVQHSSSEAPSTLHRHSSSNGGGGFGTNGFRFPGQTLPGLRDILTPASQGSPRASHTAWSPAPPPPPPPLHEQRSNEKPNHQSMALHPPLALNPPPVPRQLYPGQHDRRLDLPILETQPVAQRPPQSVPVSPYAPYGDSGRDYVTSRHERPRQASTSSYMTAGAPSPYTPLTSEDSAHRGSNASYDRSGNPPFTPTGPEATKKYLGVKEYAGEGTYHVYEGGYRIPTSVDGETVNPQWGLTKANKPRKRLALACLDCREKKIKCEPGANSCLQCEKAKRPCRRAPNQPNPNEGTPSATLSNAGSPPQDRLVEHPLDTTAHREYNCTPAAPTYCRPSEQESFVKRSAPDERHSSEAPAKRYRSASPLMTNGNASLLRQPAQYPPYHVQKQSGIVPSQRPFTRDEDPFAIDPETTMRLLDFYFGHVNNATYCIFPHQAFLRWVTTSSHTKSPNERMVLYAMLAMGSVFSGHDLAVGQRCADIAKEAESSKLGLFSLPLVQTRMLLGLFNFAKGKEGAAWDYCGLAIRAISAMRYNNEEGCIVPDHPRSQPSPTPPEYGFTNEQITECRRRTFWAGFLMDRFNGFCGGMLCVIHPADIYLRLPCATEVYERAMPSDAPFYNNGSIDPTSAILTPTSSVAPMAWLVLVGGIWGEAMNFIYRATHHGPNSYRDAYERVYADTYASMQGWLSRLPDHLRYSEINLDRSIQEGYAGTFISFHVLYHFVLMKLNRCMRHSLAPELAPRNIRAAHDHAHNLLGILCALSAARREIIQPRPGQPNKFVFSTPFPGYATLSAVDIVGAGGPDSVLGQTLDGMAGGLSCLRELAQFWHSAHDQHSAGERRLFQLKNVLTRPYKASSGCWLGRNWGFEGALEQEFDLEADCIYGVHDKIYFQALEDDAGKPRAAPAGLRMA